MSGQSAHPMAEFEGETVTVVLRGDIRTLFFPRKVRGELWQVKTYVGVTLLRVKRPLRRHRIERVEHYTWYSIRTLYHEGGGAPKSRYEVLRAIRSRYLQRPWWKIRRLLGRGPQRSRKPYRRNPSGPTKAP